VLVVVGLGILTVQYWRTASLHRLRRCRAAIPSTGREYFESPCVSIRFGALILSGISQTALEATLGQVDYCFDPVNVSVHASECLHPGWAFFYLPSGCFGGGAHLVCWRGGGKICSTAYWEWTA